MDMPRHNFFANAGFPENQYRNVGIGNLRAQFAHLHHSWIARNDFTSVSDGKPATACLAFLERTLYGSLEVFLPERFDKIIAGAEAHRLDHHVYVPHAGKDNGWNRTAGARHLLKHFKATHAGHHEIEY